MAKPKGIVSPHSGQEVTAITTLEQRAATARELYGAQFKGICQQCHWPVIEPYEKRPETCSCATPPFVHPLAFVYWDWRARAMAPVTLAKWKEIFRQEKRIKDLRAEAEARRLRNIPLELEGKAENLGR